MFNASTSANVQNIKDTLLQIAENQSVSFATAAVSQYPRKSVINATPVNTLDRSSNLAACFLESVNIGWTETHTVGAIKEIDPMFLNIASRVKDENLKTFDNVNLYICANDIDSFIRCQ